jgi:hypothetical protein
VPTSGRIGQSGSGDEARRVAINMAPLPQLLGKADRD